MTINVRIDSIVEGERARQDVGKIDGLAKSIRDVGLLQPIAVTADNYGYELVAGGRRLAAVRQLGWTEIPVHVVDNLTDAASCLRAERDENSQREPLTPTEAVALMRRLEALEKPKAKQRQRDAGGDKRSKNAGGKLPQPVEPTAKVRDVIASAVGVGARTLDKASAVVDAATNESLPEEVRAAARQAQADMDRTGKVDPAFQKVQDAAAEAGLVELAKKIDASDVGIRRRWSTAMSRTHDGLLKCDPSEVVRVTTPEHRVPLRMFVDDLQRFVDAMRIALRDAESAPLKMMKGGQR